MVIACHCHDAAAVSLLEHLTSCLLQYLNSTIKISSFLKHIILFNSSNFVQAAATHCSLTLHTFITTFMASTVDDALPSDYQYTLSHLDRTGKQSLYILYLWDEKEAEGVRKLGLHAIFAFI